MAKFIVVGYYEDNLQSLADVQEADDAYEAFAAVAREKPSVTLVQAVRLPDGECTAPCDDGVGSICAAEDFPQED